MSNGAADRIESEGCVACLRLWYGELCEFIDPFVYFLPNIFDPLFLSFICSVILSHNNNNNNNNDDDDDDDDNNNNNSNIIIIFHC